MKLKKTPIDVFDNWVKIGKDDGLEKIMLQLFPKWWNIQQVL